MEYYAAVKKNKTCHQGCGGPAGTGLRGQGRQKLTAEPLLHGWRAAVNAATVPASEAAWRAQAWARARLQGGPGTRAPKVGTQGPRCTPTPTLPRNMELTVRSRRSASLCQSVVNSTSACLPSVTTSIRSVVISKFSLCSCNYMVFKNSV